MKLQKIVVFGLSMTILSCEVLPTLAHSQQYARNTELRQLIPELSNIVKFNSRSQASEKLNETWIERKSSTSAWAKIDSTITPFLGISNSFENHKIVDYSSDKLPTLAKNNRSQALPSQELVNAIRKSLAVEIDYSQVDYSFVEIDLNGDKVKEAIVYESGRHCGGHHCYLKIFSKERNQYKLREFRLFKFFDLKLAILKQTNAGWANLAEAAYDNGGFGSEIIGWQILKFNGKEYVGGAVSKSIKPRLIIDFKKTKILNLASSGSSRK